MSRRAAARARSGVQRHLVSNATFFNVDDGVATESAPLRSDAIWTPDFTDVDEAAAHIDNRNGNCRISSMAFDLDALTDAMARLAEPQKQLVAAGRWDAGEDLPTIRTTMLAQDAFGDDYNDAMGTYHDEPGYNETGHAI